jgi:carbon monoxide dehydrogenase subunit G
MVKVETSKTVNAPAEKIYAIITDFEKLPTRFPGRYRSIKVLERSDNSTKVEEDITVAGREIHQITKHTFEPNRYLRSEVIDGDTKGTVVEITLTPEDPETRVLVKGDLKLGKLGAILGVFAKGKIKGGLEEMIDEFGNVVNNK